MLGSITKKSGKSFLLRPFGLGRKKNFVNFPYEIFTWQLDAFQGALKIVNLLISSFSHFCLMMMWLLLFLAYGVL